MATVDILGLYPPLVKTYQPAFPIDDASFRVYFAQGPFNASNTPAFVQITIKRQYTNENVLNSPSGMAILYARVDSVVTSDYRWYIEISKDMFKPGMPIVGENYKIQLRYDAKSTQVNVSPTTQQISTTLDSCSEWSSVTLVRGIIKPKLVFNPDIPEDTAKEEIPSRSIGDTVVCIYQSGQDESARYVQSLKRYRIQILNYGTKQVLSSGGVQADTGQVDVPSYDYTQGYVINYTFPVLLQSQESYTIRIWVETKNGYQITEDHSFINTNASSENFNNDAPTGYIQMNQLDGYMMIHFQTGKTMTTNVTMRRTSSKSNFTVWEDCGNLTVQREVINWDFNDFSVQSGVIYQYGFQKRDIYGRRGTLWIIPQQEIAEFEDAFLTERSLVEVYEGGELVSRKAKQLKIKYDPVISSFKYNVAESRVDTIGSKYPFIRRNASMYYRTFQISGLISRFMDDGPKNLFMLKRELFGGQDSLNASQARRENRLNTTFDKDPSVWSHDDNEGSRAVYNSENGISDYTSDEGLYYDYNQDYDYYHERIFREAVQEFLYNTSAKIYRSETEGNILVKLMDITFTPVQQLGRMLYRFSATAYEIDEPSLSNFEKYGIQQVGSYSTAIEFNITKLAQISSHDRPIIKAGTNIKEIIDGYEGLGETKNGSVITDSNISYLRLEFEGDPYLINISNPLNPYPTDIPPRGQTITDKNTMIGWVVQIDGVPIVIGFPNRIYEAKGDNVKFTNSIVPMQDCELTIDYVTSLAQAMDTSTSKATVEPSETFGQLFRTFQPDEDVLQYIYKRYRKVYGKKVTTCKGIHNLNVECYPASVIYVTTTGAGTGSNFRQRLVINHTGNLLIDTGGNQVITEAYFGGRTFHISELTPVESKSLYALERELYEKNGQKEIFYRGSWRKVINEVDGGEWLDINVEVDAIIDYTCSIETGTIAG